MLSDVVGHSRDEHTFSFVVPRAGTAVRSCSWWERERRAKAQTSLVVGESKESHFETANFRKVR